MKAAPPETEQRSRCQCRQLPEEWRSPVRCRRRWPTGRPALAAPSARSPPGPPGARRPPGTPRDSGLAHEQRQHQRTISWRSCGAQPMTMRGAPRCVGAAWKRAHDVAAQQLAGEVLGGDANLPSVPGGPDFHVDRAAAPPGTPSRVQGRMGGTQQLGRARLVQCDKRCVQSSAERRGAQRRRPVGPPALPALAGGAGGQRLARRIMPSSSAAAWRMATPSSTRPFTQRRMPRSRSE